MANQREPIVWIPADSGHDYSDARRYGNLRFLSEGPMNIFDVTHMHRLFEKRLEKSQRQDFLLNSGLSQMQQVAAGILINKHQRLNLLLCKFVEGEPTYVSRQIVFNRKQEMFPQ